MATDSPENMLRSSIALSSSKAIAS
jgi:hypothetical protein